MNSLFAIALVLASITFCDVSSRKIENRIVGGIVAPDTLYKYQVSLRNRQLDHFCGGSIIRPNYVLTSAKCVDGMNPRDVSVVAGTKYLYPTPFTFPASQLIIHGSYNSNTLQNDIALVKTAGNLLSIPNTEMIGLSVSPAYPGQPSTLTGWGTEHITIPNYSNNLRFADFNVISISDCKRQHPGYTITNLNVCTGPNGRGGCNGDNGGPLVTFNVQIGILSWGIPCATGVPDVYTDVASYYNWINQNTWS